ncbi:MAG: Fe-S cluster assembly ATPase SufC [Verrucomicrobiota bacterium]|nr:Fe-S cluster assembly ATPase SufC [Verrucomicrobiota bacterium]
MNTLEISQLNVSIHGQAILKDFNLTIPKGEVHALMGPNGTGKSTLAKVMAGHEDYTVDSGDIVLDGVSILGKEPDEISHAGLFLAFQYPMEIPGVSIANFIRAARAARLEDGKEVNAVEFYKELYAKMDALKMDRKFTARSLNEGFSGGEKKRCEILQMSMLEPKYCVMDETDSGLDIDALKVVSEGVNHMRSKDRGFLVITHYQRLLDYIVPDVVHVMFDGRVVHSGNAELAKELETKGYDWVQEEFVTTTA